MNFFRYDDVPLFLGVSGRSGEYIFAEDASIAISQNLTTKRYIDDNLIRFTDDSSLAISAGVSEYTLGPSGGPPQPLSTSIYKIPSGTPIQFPGNKTLFFEDNITPNGHDYIANLRSYSGFNLPAGASGGYFKPIYKSSANGPVAGTLNVSFYINGGNLPSFFNITGLRDPHQYPPIDEEKITGFLGNFRFSDAYLKSLSFSMSPEQVSQAKASFLIFGELTEDSSLISNYYNSSLYNQQSVPHGMHSQLIGTMDGGIENPVSFTYSMTVNRTPRYVVGTGNHKDTFELGNGLVPARVTKDFTTISMSINGESIDPKILEHGFGGKRANLTAELRDLSYSSFEDNSSGLLQTFHCSGIINSQNLSVKSDGHLKGGISVSQRFN